MAHRLFFRNLVNVAAGTFPSGEQSALSADYTAASGATLKMMSINTNFPGGMTSHSGNSLASASAQSGLYGMFVSNRFGENQDISIQTLTINIAMQESDTNMNMGAGLTANVYVWRPSTGALVGTLCANLALTGAAEPTAGSIRVVQGAATTSAVSALFADMIICEIWQTHTQGSAISYTGGLYFDGSVVTTVNDTLVTDHASFINFAFDNLQIEQGFANGALNVTLDALTLAATGIVTTPPPPAVTTQISDGGHGVQIAAKKRKKFKIPDLEIEPQRTLEQILEIETEPEIEPVEEVPPVPMKSISLGQAVAANPPVMKTAVPSRRTSTLPKSSPVVEEEEYSDEDLKQLVLMVMPWSNKNG